MDKTSTIINKVFIETVPKLIIEGSDGVRYYVDLNYLSDIFCFPQNQKEWEQVSIDSYGLALIWSSRFEVHIDQLIGLAYKSEYLLSQSA